MTYLRHLCLCELPYDTTSMYWVQSRSEGKTNPVRALLGVIMQSLRPLRRLKVSAAGPCRYGRTRRETRRAVPCSRHSILCLKGSTWRKGNFVEPVLFQLERWDFTLRQTLDREMRGVLGEAVWERQRSVERRSREGIRGSSCQTTWGKMHAWIL